MGIKEDILGRQKSKWRKLFEDIMVIALMVICLITIVAILLLILELVFKIPSGHPPFPTTGHYRIKK